MAYNTAPVSYRPPVYNAPVYKAPAPSYPSNKTNIDYRSSNTFAPVDVRNNWKQNNLQQTYAPEYTDNRKWYTTKNDYLTKNYNTTNNDYITKNYTTNNDYLTKNYQTTNNNYDYNYNNQVVYAPFNYSSNVSSNNYSFVDNSKFSVGGSGYNTPSYGNSGYATPTTPGYGGGHAQKPHHYGHRVHHHRHQSGYGMPQQSAYNAPGATPYDTGFGKYGAIGSAYGAGGGMSPQSFFGMLSPQEFFGGGAFNHSMFAGGYGV
jgi:hypothetical protein